MILDLFKNREVKRYAVVLIIFHLILSILMITAFQYKTQQLYQSVIGRNISVIGYLVDHYPQLEEEIVPLFTKDLSEGFYNNGVEVAKKYGYQESLSYKVDPAFRSYRKSQYLHYALFPFIFLIISISISIAFLNILYGKVRSYADYAEKVVEGDFNHIYDIESEGDFAKLSYQFDQMVKRLKASIEALSNEKILLKNIISDISHQLKTPLTSIKIFNELLLDGEIEDPAMVKDFLNKIRGQTERMEWLTHSLLKMAKLETNSIEFSNENKCIQSTIEKAIVPLKEKWEEKKQEVILETGDPISVYHDEGWMGEAIENIVKNAIEHTRERGKIYIRVKESPISVKIQIQDNGDGISKEDLPYVFQRFYKGRYNQKVNSTGIGLALAKTIVENQNGIIEVKSKLNEGTIFTIIMFKYKNY